MKLGSGYIAMGKKSRNANKCGKHDGILTQVLRTGGGGGGGDILCLRPCSSAGYRSLPFKRGSGVTWVVKEPTARSMELERKASRSGAGGNGVLKKADKGRRNTKGEGRGKF